MGKYSTVDDYINDQPDNSKELLRILKKCILEAVPEATETFTYGVPAFILVKEGKMDQQIMIAGFKKHVGLYPHPTTIEKFTDELKDYKKGKGSVQFPFGEPIPRELIVEMVRYRKRSIEIK